MSDGGVIVKQKTLPELTRRVPIIEVHEHSRLGRKKMWGGTTVYPRLFGVNISSMFLLRTTNKNGNSLAHPIGLYHPHHRGIVYLSPLTTGLLSHPQEGL